jgi:glycosyltransferase involved in cell wall biosynthesis
MIHELFPQYFLRRDPTVEYKKEVLLRADHIIAVSENTKNDVVKFYGISPKKVSVVYHGGELSDRLSLISDFDRSSSGEKYLLHVGKRDGYKNFKEFISAISSLLREDQSLKVFCVGGGKFTEEETFFFCKQQINKQIIHYFVEDNVLSGLYRNAFALVVPSLYEGFGIPVAEAFHQGCSVIISNGSSLPEVGGDAAVYFDPRDPHSMLEAVRKVVAEPLFRFDLKKKSLARASMFSWQKTAEATKRVYEKVIGG